MSFATPAWLSLGIAILALGLAPLCKKAALSAGMNPIIVALGPSVVAAIVSVALLASLPASKVGMLLRWPQARHLLVIGFVASGMVTLLAAYAMVDTTATNRSLFQSLYPAATVVFAWFMLGERLRPAQYVIIAVMLVGLFLMQNPGGQIRLGVGFWLLALTLPLIGFSDAYAKRVGGELSPNLIGAGRHVYGMVFLVLCLPFVPAPEWQGEPHGWWWLLGAGLALAVGVFAFYAALRASQASLVAAFVSLAPLVTAAGEVALLELRLDVGQWSGLWLVIAGAAALAWYRPRPLARHSAATLQQAERWRPPGFRRRKRS